MSETNNLNSVLIEGILVEDAVEKRGEFQDEVVAFILSSKRLLRHGDGSLEKQVNFFRVFVRGNVLRKACMEKAKKGCGVRVIGFLVGGRPSAIYIEAEHVEFRSEAQE